jgi:hypothetical protein
MAKVNKAQAPNVMYSVIAPLTGDSDAFNPICSTMFHKTSDNSEKLEKLISRDSEENLNTHEHGPTKEPTNEDRKQYERLYSKHIQLCGWLDG